MYISAIDQCASVEKPMILCGCSKKQCLLQSNNFQPTNQLTVWISCSYFNYSVVGLTPTALSCFLYTKNVPSTIALIHAKAYLYCLLNFILVANY